MKNRTQSKVARQITSKKYSLMSQKKKETTVSQDTIDRKNLQSFIEQSIREGYSDEDIKVVLEKKYPKYAEFIPVWIENKRKQFSSNKREKNDR
ncbi:MAG: hypothetical protein IKF52_02125 [Clostridia bacterium]|nr:hypothetical protein [Clostridia bacterium]